MLKINTITIKNFLSIGNQTQAVRFDNKDLTLLLGENLDLGGDKSGNKNGSGKTTLINALSYGLYGQAVTSIKRDNLINKSNGKQMLVTVEFEKNGTLYRVERGRRPNILKYYIGDTEQVNIDEGLGDSRETQAVLESVIGMSHDMFRHIVALNTYTQPFLSLGSNDQRQIIEQLLGITILSKKADILREQSKQTKDSITQEEFSLKAIESSNANIQTQIDTLKKRQKLWNKTKSDDITRLQAELEQISNINIDDEIQAHKNLIAFYEASSKKNLLQRSQRSNMNDHKKYSELLIKLRKEIESISAHTCYACGTKLHDEKQETILKDKQELLKTVQEQYNACNVELNSIKEKITQIDKTIGTAPKVFYDNMEDAYNHKSKLEKVVHQLSTRNNDVDPYIEQIEFLQSNGMQPVSYDLLNTLSKIRDHEDFLLKLLTNKDSFIRKRIIDQNLSFLNKRLGYYLDQIGLPHTVVFKNDLSVEIQELGRDLDFDNLSRGERNRLILSLSWAFRDVYESLYEPINLLSVDELLDNGLDTSGVEASLAVLKKMCRERNKSVWLISHREELIGRVNNIMRAVKENGFSSFSSDLEIR